MPLPALAACILAAAPAPKETPMTRHAHGPFDVKLAPKDPDHASGEAGIARFVLDKAFHGDLEAGSVGQMLSYGDPRGSAGYVALERVTGTLGGRKGSFALMHSGTMEQGHPELRIQVVPGSGTGELAGIKGTLAIRFEAGGKHFYDFEYALPEKN